MKVTELSRLIREIVQDEMKKTIGQLVKECLTETYLRRIVSEQSSPTSHSVTKKTGKLSEVLADSDEEDDPSDVVPVPVKNNNKGVYQAAEDKKMNEARNRLRSGVWGEMFDDVQPLSESASGAAEIPENELTQNFDFKRMSKLAGISSSSSSRSTTLSEQESLRRIEAQRQALEVPVSSLR